MIDCNSNCSRVDAAKALANQLRVQAVARQKLDEKQAGPDRLQSDLLELDAQIRSGDAKKAENAIGAVKREINSPAPAPEASNQGAANQETSTRGFLAYA